MQVGARERRIVDGGRRDSGEVGAGQVARVVPGLLDRPRLLRVAAAERHVV